MFAGLGATLSVVWMMGAIGGSASDRAASRMRQRDTCMNPEWILLDRGAAPIIVAADVRLLLR